MMLTPDMVSMALMCCLKSEWNIWVISALLTPAFVIWSFSWSRNSARGWLKFHFRHWGSDGDKMSAVSHRVPKECHLADLVTFHIKP